MWETANTSVFNMSTPASVSPYDVNTPPVDRSQYLDSLSDRAALRLLPVLVYLGLMMVVGVGGNILVLYVHLKKFKSSSTRFYVLSLAVFDLLSCCISIPGEMVDLRYSFTFYSESWCRAERLCTTFTALASGFTLVAVAVDRYRRICFPLRRQLQKRGTRYMVSGACFLSVVFSWPSLIIYGSKTVDTDYPDIKGVECSTADSFRGTIYPKIYLSMLSLTFVLSFGTMIVLYTMIGRKVFHQKRFRKESTSMNNKPRTFLDSEKTPSSPSLNKSPSFPSEADRPSYDDPQSEYSVGSEPGRKSSVENNSKSVSLSRKTSFLKGVTKRLSSKTRDAMTRKTTFMLFLITLVFVISFLPHLILKGLQALNKNFLRDVNTASLIFYNIFVRCYFLNSIANAFIYGFCSPRFRKECQALFKTLVCKRKCYSLNLAKDNYSQSNAI